MLDFVDMHEQTGEVIQYLDDNLSNFLIDLNKNQALDDTLILFYSDHG